MESNKYTMKEISEKVGVSYYTVKSVLIGRSNKQISKLYNIENFNNYEFRKRKLKYI